MHLRQVLTFSVLALLAGYGHGQRILTGTGSGGPNIFRGNDAFGRCFFAHIPPFGTGSGVTVAAGNNLGGNDFITDFIVGQRTGSPMIRVYNGATNAIVHSFLAFNSPFNGGVFVAGGDVNGDGVTDILAGGNGPDGPVKVFNGVNLSLIHSFLAFPGFSGGVHVASGDVNNDGLDDVIVAPGPGMVPHVQAFHGVTGATLHSFFAYPTTFLGGVSIASGDVNGDGFADIITGTAGSDSQVKAFSGADLAILRDFLAYGPGFAGGVNVGAGDINADGNDDIITGAGNVAPEVIVFNGTNGNDIIRFSPEGPGHVAGFFVAGAGPSGQPDFGFATNKTTVAGQNSVLGTIQLNGIAGNDTIVTTFDNSSLVQTPPSVTVLSGTSFRNFQITTTAITSTVNTILSARLGGITKTRPLQIAPLVPTSVSFNPGPVKGGDPTTMRIIINGVAGPGGRNVSIVENSPFLIAPMTVVIPPGGTQFFAGCTTVSTPVNRIVPVKAVVSAGQVQGNLVITP